MHLVYWQPASLKYHPAMKRRWLVRLLVLVILAAFIVWLEPTRVIWGWLRGEAFYQGRPTSYWENEIGRWQSRTCAKGYYELPVLPGSPRLYLVVETAHYQRTKPWDRFIDSEGYGPAPWPKLLDGDPAGRPVLQDLLNSASPHVREWAEAGLRRHRDQNRGPEKIWTVWLLPRTCW
jgi:hypothetical protein